MTVHNYLASIDYCTLRTVSTAKASSGSTRQPEYSGRCRWMALGKGGTLGCKPSAPNQHTMQHAHDPSQWPSHTLPECLERTEYIRIGERCISRSVMCVTGSTGWSGATQRRVRKGSFTLDASRRTAFPFSLLCAHVLPPAMSLRRFPLIPTLPLE